MKGKSWGCESELESGREVYLRVAQTTVDDIEM